MPAVNASQRVQAVQRAAALLTALGAHGEPATAFVLADRCGLNRSTAWRILATLEDQGLVERDPATGRYSVGYALVALAARAGHEPLVRRAHPHLRALAEACAETASLAVPRRLQLVYVDQVQAPHVMAANWLGRATPLHATSTGKAFLAGLAGDELAAALPSRLRRYTDTTITSRAALRAELDAVRARGYAVSRGELEPALWGVSAPVLDRGRVVAVVSVWGSEARIRARGIEALGAGTAAAAAEIGARVARAA
ncbi:MAG TPA: IclR family transcriptional regulator [Solirubrobacteraceae bacterium]|nr:IclR family transcriptional regulator [Solirubrobacteraceae bacterium]